MADVSPLEGIKNFASTRTGKAVIAGGALILALALFALGYSYIGGGKPSTGTSGISQGTKPVGSIAKGVGASGLESTEAAEPKEPPIDVDSYSQEQFRDPFRPIDESATASVLDALQAKLKDSLAERGGAGYVPNLSLSVSGSGGGTSTQGALKLESIAESGGKRTATVIFNGTRYEVGVGDRIDSSSYQVVDIGSDNITVLYGDDRLTLTVGGTLSK